METISTYYIDIWGDKCYINIEVLSSYKETRAAILKATHRKRLLAGEPALLKQLFKSKSYEQKN